jgi:hypothetical protein
MTLAFAYMTGQQNSFPSSPLHRYTVHKDDVRMAE